MYEPTCPRCHDEGSIEISPSGDPQDAIDVACPDCSDYEPDYEAITERRAVTRGAGAPADNFYL